MTYTNSYQQQNSGASAYSPFNRTAGAQQPTYQGYPDAVNAPPGSPTQAGNSFAGPDVYLAPSSPEDIDSISGNIDNKIAQIRRAFQGAPPAGAAPAGTAPNAPAVPQADIDWALQLEQKVQQQGHTPTAQETARYEAIAQKLSQPAPTAPPAGAPAAPAVPQAEIDWALQLEQKVQQGHTPTAQETARYEAIAQKLSQPTPTAPPAGAPAAPAVSQADIDWALQLEQKVQQGHTPTAQETGRYEAIAQKLSQPAPTAPAAGQQQGPRNWANWGSPFNVPAAPTMPLPIAGPGGQAVLNVPTSLRGAPQAPPAARMNQQPGAAAGNTQMPQGVSQQEIDWALQLEQKVQQQGYTPNAQENAQYQNLAQRITAAQQQQQAPQTNAPPVGAPQRPQTQNAQQTPAGVSQQEIDWALQLEQRVNTQNYQPNAQETAQYQNIAQRITAAQQQPAPTAPQQQQFTPPPGAPQQQFTPPPGAPQQQFTPPQATTQAPQALPNGLSQQEIDWALQLEQRVNTQNYQPNAQELAAYEGIAQRLNGPQQAPQQQFTPPPSNGPQMMVPGAAPQVQIVPQSYPQVQQQTPQMLVPPHVQAPFPAPQQQQFQPPQQQAFPPQQQPPAAQGAGITDRLKNAWNALWG